jgi:hypothetical protein
MQSTTLSNDFMEGLHICYDGIDFVFVYNDVDHKQPYTSEVEKRQ